MQMLLNLYLKLFHFWMRFPQKLRFLLVGGYNTLFSYVLFAVFVNFSGNETAQISLLAAYVISSVNNYLTQKFYVFNTRGHYWREYIKCCTVWMASYGVNAILLYLFMHFLGLNPYAGQFIAVIGVIVFNYVFLKHFAFNSRGLKHIKQLFTRGR